MKPARKVKDDRWGEFLREIEGEMVPGYKVSVTDLTQLSGVIRSKLGK
jgi:hypothetical protein